MVQSPTLPKAWRFVLQIAPIAMLLFARNAWAIRPFVTDDARVVGPKLGQLETWIRLDGATAQHWVLAAVGPTNWLEVTVGGLHGIDRAAGASAYSAVGPLLQAKVLARETRPHDWPGIALACGVMSPFGIGMFKPPTWDPFVYAATTASLLDDERLLLHANIGAISADTPRALQATWGVGAQLRVWGGLHLVSEIFSGDPYADSASGAYQAGFRYVVSDAVQLDTTVGDGVWGGNHKAFWGTAGLRVVSPLLW